MAALCKKRLSVALAFVAGAILLCSCGERAPEIDPAADESMMTEYSENLTIVESQNGKRSYRFTTPLVEGYSQAREPYREFRKGIRMVTYQDDSLSSVDVVLTANYAIYYEKRKLWEAKGNVVVEKFDGKKLYTQQLFWNATTKKVYSNVDTRIVQGDRVDAIGAGFETDEEFKDWRFRYSKGQTEIDVAPRDPADSAQRTKPAATKDRPKSSTERTRKSRPVEKTDPASGERNAWPDVDPNAEAPAKRRIALDKPEAGRRSVSPRVSERMNGSAVLEKKRGSEQVEKVSSNQSAAEK